MLGLTNKFPFHVPTTGPMMYCVTYKATLDDYLLSGSRMPTVPTTQKAETLARRFQYKHTHLKQTIPTLDDQKESAEKNGKISFLEKIWEEGGKNYPNPPTQILIQMLFLRKKS